MDSARSQLPDGVLARPGGPITAHSSSTGCDKPARLCWLLCPSVSDGPHYGVGRCKERERLGKVDTVLVVNPLLASSWVCAPLVLRHQRGPGAAGGAAAPPAAPGLIALQACVDAVGEVAQEARAVGLTPPGRPRARV